jgi:hypothetical protein
MDDAVPKSENNTHHNKTAADQAVVVTPAPPPPTAKRPTTVVLTRDRRLLPHLKGTTGVEIWRRVGMLALLANLIHSFDFFITD